MKENTRFCTRSLRDNTRFGGVIQLTEFSPYPNSTTLSHGSHFAENIIQTQKLKAKQSTVKEVDEFVY